MSQILDARGNPIEPPQPESPLPIVERAIDTAEGLKVGEKELAKIEVSGKEVEFICDDAFIKARPWPCCQRPLFVSMIKAKDSEGKEIERPLLALCDKKAGHPGLHRGRADNNTYIWRSRRKGS